MILEARITPNSINMVEKLHKFILEFNLSIFMSFNQADSNLRIVATKPNTKGPNDLRWERFICKNPTDYDIQVVMSVIRKLHQGGKQYLIFPETFIVEGEVLPLFALIVDELVSDRYKESVKIFYRLGVQK